MSMPAAKGADTEQTDGQAGTDMAPEQEQPETDGVNIKQMNLKAASRRFNSRKTSGQRSTASI